MSLQELAEEFSSDYTLTQIESLWALYVPVAPNPKNQITEEEFRFFLDRCISSGLDPFEKQIGIIKRGGKVSIDANISGLRAIAERSGLYAGTTPSFWCGEDGEWKEIWLKRWGYPVAAKIGVYKRGCAEPFWGTTMWDEFVQSYNGKPGDMWAKMPAHMLGKTAEAIALKRAFPSGAKTEVAVIDTSFDAAISASYRRAALPGNTSLKEVFSSWENKFLRLSQITTCPMPTIRALCSKWMNCGINALNEDTANKLRSLVLIQWASTIHSLTEQESVALFKGFWQPTRRSDDDEVIFQDWKDFVQTWVKQLESEAIEVQPQNQN